VPRPGQDAAAMDKHLESPLMMHSCLQSQAQARGFHQHRVRNCAWH
jgi:hypothetical protein